MQCTHCGATLNPSDRFCPSCGTPVEQPKTCPQCGAPVDDSMRFCMNCGARLPEVNEGGAAAEPTQETATENATVAEPTAEGPAAGEVSAEPAAEQSDESSTESSAESTAAESSAQSDSPEQALPDAAVVADANEPEPAASDQPQSSQQPEAATPVPQSESPTQILTPVSQPQTAFTTPMPALPPDPATQQQAPIVPPVTPGSVPPAPVAPGTGSQPPKKPRKWLVPVIIAVVVVLIAAGVGIWWWMSRSNSSTEASASPSASASASASTSPSSKQSATTKAEKKSCTASPDATLTDVSSSGTNLIATLSLDDSACGSEQYKESNIRVNIKDYDGDVIAAAVFDFAKKPISFDDGEATLALAFTSKQYWMPVDEIDSTSSMEVVWQTGQKPNGKAAANVASALGGANISSDDAERYAQLALTNQLDHDRSDASDFYDHYTTQLSSKKYGMQVDGKTWKYSDIYEQFLNIKQKHPNALLIWASDYSNYTKNGNPSDYYVILSGESFSSEDDAQSWCSTNGYSSDDCMAVDLE